MIKILARNWIGNSLVIVFNDGQVKTKIIESSSPNWGQVMELYKQGKFEELVPLLDMDAAIAAKFGNHFTVKDGKVFYHGKPAHGYLIDKILFFMSNLPDQAQRLVKFAENLYQNPDQGVVENLYKFLEHGNFPITDDGKILGYKGIGSDYYSITSGTTHLLRGGVKNGRIYNGIGEIIEMVRRDVDNDPEHGCSYGLHVGEWSYAQSFRGTDGRLMVVKVDPKDVVSVPADYEFKKLRTCKYEVIAEEGRKLNEVRDSNFEQVAKQKLRRDSLGRFCSKWSSDYNDWES